jgi:hypothetical protein
VTGRHIQNRSPYLDVTSPTTSKLGLIMCLTITAERNYCMAKCTIGGAYISAKMTFEEIMMKLDHSITSLAEKMLPEMKGFVGNSGQLFVKLYKVLYGYI